MSFSELVIDIGTNTVAKLEYAIIATITADVIAALEYTPILVVSGGSKRLKQVTKNKKARIPIAELIIHFDW